MYFALPVNFISFSDEYCLSWNIDVGGDICCQYILLTLLPLVNKENAFGQWLGSVKPGWKWYIEGRWSQRETM